MNAKAPRALAQGPLYGRARAIGHLGAEPMVAEAMPRVAALIDWTHTTNFTTHSATQTIRLAPRASAPLITRRAT